MLATPSKRGPRRLLKSFPAPAYQGPIDGKGQLLPHCGEQGIRAKRLFQEESKVSSQKRSIPKRKTLSGAPCNLQHSKDSSSHSRARNGEKGGLIPLIIPLPWPRVRFHMLPSRTFSLIVMLVHSHLYTKVQAILRKKQSFTSYSQY